MKKSMYRLALTAIAASLLLIGVSLQASETDDRIGSSAKKSYVFRTYLKGDDIRILSENGAVTLTGTVSQESGKSLALDTVAGLPGVKSVDNQLEVKGQVPAAYSDAWVAARVKSSLLYHRNVNLAGTKVSAKDGTVTLRGEASNKAQKDLTTEYAKDAEGVKKVKNEMTIAKKPGKKTVSEKMVDMTEWIDDASITALVKTTLLYHRSTGGLGTGVETKEGVVTLEGKAKNSAERDLAGKFVSDIRGVKRVVNNMTIE